MSFLSLKQQQLPLLLFPPRYLSPTCINHSPSSLFNLACKSLYTLHLTFATPPSLSPSFVHLLVCSLQSFKPLDLGQPARSYYTQRVSHQTHRAIGPNQSRVKILIDSLYSDNQLSQVLHCHSTTILYLLFSVSGSPTSVNLPSLLHHNQVPQHVHNNWSHFSVCFWAELVQLFQSFCSIVTT